MQGILVSLLSAISSVKAVETSHHHSHPTLLLPYVHPLECASACVYVFLHIHTGTYRCTRHASVRCSHGTLFIITLYSSILVRNALSFVPIFDAEIRQNVALQAVHQEVYLER